MFGFSHRKEHLAPMIHRSFFLFSKTCKIGKKVENIEEENWWVQIGINILSTSVLEILTTSKSISKFHLIMGLLFMES